MGKTTFTALLVRAILSNKSGRLLVIDGDPDLNLHISLGLPEPQATIATIKDMSFAAGVIRRSGQTPVGYVEQQLTESGVIQPYTWPNNGATFDFLAMGVGQENGCYCAVNQALAGAFKNIQRDYDLILVDSPAGTEHLSRQRITRADILFLLQTKSPASHAVTTRIRETVQRTGMYVGHQVVVNNFAPNEYALRVVTRSPNVTEMVFPGDPCLTAGDLPYQIDRVSLAMMASHELVKEIEGSFLVR